MQGTDNLPAEADKQYSFENFQQTVCLGSPQSHQIRVTGDGACGCSLRYSSRPHFWVDLDR